MNTTTRILTVLAACLFATQAQAMQIKGKSYNAVKSIKSSKLIPGLTSVDLTKFVLGSKSYVSPKGNKQTIPGGYPKLDKNKVKKVINDWGNKDWGNKDWGKKDWGCKKKDCRPPPVNVPEPSILALLGTGLLLIGFSQRRKPR